MEIRNENRYAEFPWAKSEYKNRILKDPELDYKLTFVQSTLKLISTDPPYIFQAWGPDSKVYCQYTMSAKVQSIYNLNFSVLQLAQKSYVDLNGTLVPRYCHPDSPHLSVFKTMDYSDYFKLSIKSTLGLHEQFHIVLFNCPLKYNNIGFNKVETSYICNLYSPIEVQDTCHLLACLYPSTSFSRSRKR